MVFGFEIEHLHNVSSWCFVLWFVIEDRQRIKAIFYHVLWLPFFGMTCVTRITLNLAGLFINVEAKTSGLGFVGNDIHQMSLGHSGDDVMAHLLE